MEKCPELLWVHFLIKEVDMDINSISSIGSELSKLQKTVKQDKQFDNLFSSLIKDVNQSQTESANMIKDFAAGKDVELHDIMIAGEKAKTNLDLLMEIRNKTLDMYKELTRMQT